MFESLRVEEVERVSICNQDSLLYFLKISQVLYLVRENISLGVLIQLEQFLGFEGKVKIKVS